jgi:hypothetical protein
MLHWEHSIYGAETWTLREVHEKGLEVFQMMCCRRIEISWTERVKSDQVVHRVKEERNILYTIQRRPTNWIFYILRRNYLLKHVIEGKIKGTGIG